MSLGDKRVHHVANQRLGTLGRGRVGGEVYARAVWQCARQSAEMPNQRVFGFRRTTLVDPGDPSSRGVERAVGSGLRSAQDGQIVEQFACAPRGGSRSITHLGATMTVTA